MTKVLRLVALALLVVGCGGGSTVEELPVGPTLPPAADQLQSASAGAMGEVQSVRFTLERTGAPVFIDAAGAISLESLEGIFSAPASAEAELVVLVNQSLGTKIGAVAIDEEIWLSNPVTGRFETLPPGFDIDPSSLFDPKGAWQPLLEDLTDVELVGQVDRDGPRYHLQGTASEERIRAITAGLVRGDDVQVDMWIETDTGRARSLEFSTMLGGAQTDWVLELNDYGEPFTIVDPTIDQ